MILKAFLLTEDWLQLAAALTSIMRSQHGAFLAVASRIATSHTHVEALRDEVSS